MNRADITSATVFPKLRLILEEDIKFLKELMKVKKVDSDIYELLDSLVYAKQKILDKFPANEKGIGKSATTATNLQMVGHKSDEDKKDLSIVSALASVENEQMDFVKHATVNEGMPPELLVKLEEILGIYQTISDQLNRSYKTRQINRVVV